MSITAPTSLPEEVCAARGPVTRVPTADYSLEDQMAGHGENSRAQTITKSKNCPGAAQWQVVWLPVERIDPSPWQPRTFFDAQEMEELIQSVKRQGVQQPILVRTSREEVSEAIDTSKTRTQKAPTRYHLVAGERRLRACRGAGKKLIPAIVRDDLSDLQVAEMALLENVQRANLSAIEEAKGYRRLMSEFHLSEVRVAKKAGKSLPVVQSLIKLLALPEGVQQLIRLRKLSAAHGYELLRLLASSEVCQSVATHASNHHLPATSLGRDPIPNVRELEKRGLIVPLDYRTRFDITMCKSCPHKAHLSSGYASYCLQPQEWKRKQDEALAHQADEAARVLEEARRQREASASPHPTDIAEAGPDVGSLPLLLQLPRGSYRDLRFGEIPPQCTGACPCRGCALDPHAPGGGDESGGQVETTGTRVPLCLDVARFQELQRAERVRREEERARHFTQRFESALQVLQGAWHAGNKGKAFALAFTPFLNGHSSRGSYLVAGEMEGLIKRVSHLLDVAFPWDQVFDEDSEDITILRVLAQCESRHGDVCTGEGVDPSGVLPLLGAGILLALEAHSAAKWGGDTPLLDFVLPPVKWAQTSLSFESGESPLGCETEHEGEDDADDPFMEEDFAVGLAEPTPFPEVIPAYVEVTPAANEPWA